MRTPGSRTRGRAPNALVRGYRARSLSCVELSVAVRLTERVSVEVEQHVEIDAGSPGLEVPELHVTEHDVVGRAFELEHGNEIARPAFDPQEVALARVGRHGFFSERRPAPVEHEQRGAVGLAQPEAES